MQSDKVLHNFVAAMSFYFFWACSEKTGRDSSVIETSSYLIFEDWIVLDLIHSFHFSEH